MSGKRRQNLGQNASSASVVVGLMIIYLAISFFFSFFICIHHVMIRDLYTYENHRKNPIQKTNIFWNAQKE